MHDTAHANGADTPEIAGPIAFSEQELAEVERLKQLYPTTKSAIMPVLWLAQKKWGWLSHDVMKYVGTLLDLPFAHVYGVATFYTMYFKRPMGRHHIQVCTNVSCLLRGGERLFDQVRNRLGIQHNQRTADGAYSLEEVECMGACGGAPMVAVNEDYHENMTPDALTQLLDGLK